MGLVSDLWRMAEKRSGEFDAQALDYDKYRPRYPEPVFDEIVSLADLAPGAHVLEVGAGTGIATVPLVHRGLDVTAIEPAPAMADVLDSKIPERVRIIVSRFEDYSPEYPMSLLASFNAWHWIKPSMAVERTVASLEPGGWLAFVWTEVLSWGQGRFEERLAETFGEPWPKRLGLVDGSMQSNRKDQRFGDFQVFHHPFERTLDAQTFVSVTKTYGGNRTSEQYQAIERIINREFDGTITKVEDAVLYLARLNG